MTPTHPTDPAPLRGAGREPDQNPKVNLFPAVPPEHDVRRPEGQQWRQLIERCAIAALVRGGLPLVAAATKDLRPADFNGDHQTVCEVLAAMGHDRVEVTGQELAARLGDRVDGLLLASIVADVDRIRPGETPDPVWLQHQSLNDFLHELRSDETALYLWYDADNVLIYIGITEDLASRQNRHAKRSSWAAFAAHCEVRRRPSRPNAEQLERELIRELRPLFNVQHNDTPEARQRLVDYLIKHGRTDLLAPNVSRG
ncbi:GIY-YIG nuclease family protein [Micromonospora sp. NPDC006766]|uniref:GIY-YIG nuclease family protein n=1 Tax=Micromonospora sp. NPDC006766 TaxID=3154778 RepID=UPI0033F623A6